MADNEKEGEETPGRGNDWEVVSLTASTYAAAPGPKSFEGSEDDKDRELSKDNKEECSPALFMSDHFVFPPSEHENLPIEVDSPEIIENPSNLSESVDGSKPDSQIYEIRNEAEVDVAEDDRLERILEHKKTAEEETLHGIVFFDDKDVGGSTICDKGSIIAEELKGAEETDDPSSPSNLGSLSESLRSAKPLKEKKSDGSGLPCEAWWKRHAASLYAQAKEANTFWSIFVAAAVMGLVILGQRWQQERWKVQQLKFGINDEKINRIFGPMSRFKDVLVGQQRGPSIRNVPIREQ
ncbi:ATG8-interacting protein 2 isoform X2 [Amborella trichopoda]|uniref:ATG8-interacting protein 2 isoform X2 n=1 Tax=Amborella trichopoda TaxID=13333 RepID=UPI0005D40264|nr:ATG8-interacting protein 2 isoform X2 [Amborella trichopoda]|eukprot:XP_011624872.1 ATG8-interacting protein 2 isoform X2 [Amborella trichopoda]